MKTSDSGPDSMSELKPLKRSERKNQAIVEAATELFLTNGYSRTSVEDIARRAKVSKQTIYMHFDGKESLLIHIVNAIMTAASDPFDNEIHRLGESDNLDRDLRQHAREQLDLVMQPRPLQLRRLVTAEAATFPQLGQIFYDGGPGLTIRHLAAAFTRLHERGLLNIADPVRAASDFNWLVMAEPVNRAMLLGHRDPPQDYPPHGEPPNGNSAHDESTHEQWADGAVATFLAAYRPPKH